MKLEIKGSSEEFKRAAEAVCVPIAVEGDRDCLTVTADCGCVMMRIADADDLKALELLDRESITVHEIEHQAANREALIVRAEQLALRRLVLTELGLDAGDVQAEIDALKASL